MRFCCSNAYPQATCRTRPTRLRQPQARACAMLGFTPLQRLLDDLSIKLKLF
jgi:hypothetical protein